MHTAFAKQHPFRARRRLFAVVALSWGMLACGNPCRDLSEKICGCMTSYDARQSCNTRIGTLDTQFNTDPASPSYITPNAAAAGQSRCAQLLESCTCTALQNGDYQACGLAREVAGP